MARKRTWKFSDSISSSTEAIKTTRRMEDEIAWYRRRISRAPGNSSPQIQARSLETTVGVVRRCEAIVLADRDPEAAWPRVHLVWRYWALRWRVFLDRATQLAREYEERGRRGRVKIGKIDFNGYNSILMTMAFSAVLGETEASHWFGDRCLKLMTENELIAEPSAWTTGSVEPFLLRLYCM